MTQSKYDPFKHANHNYSVFQYLGEKEEFKDWEITTAFYTSMKFIEGSLFPNYYKDPINKESKEFKTFIEYRKLCNRTLLGKTPHDIIKLFVEDNLPNEIWEAYKDLYGLCHNSRYKNYNINDKELEIAKESLNEIRSYCIDNQK